MARLGAVVLLATNPFFHPKTVLRLVSKRFRYLSVSLAKYKTKFINVSFRSYDTFFTYNINKLERRASIKYGSTRIKINKITESGMLLFDIIAKSRTHKINVYNAGNKIMTDYNYPNIDKILLLMANSISKQDFFYSVSTAIRPMCDIILMNLNKTKVLEANPVILQIDGMAEKLSAIKAISISIDTDIPDLID